MAVRASNILAGFAVAVLAAEGAFFAVRGDTGLLRPPGAQGEADFSSRCVKCGKCIQSCPYQVLHPAGIEAGALVGSPVVDARAQACRLCEDFPCVASCPTGALRDVSTREDVRMGVTVIDEERCLSFQGMRCEVCYRACPLIDSALTIDYRMRENDDIHSVFAPVVHEDACVGCGLCVERCVVDDPPAVRIVADSDRERD